MGTIDHTPTTGVVITGGGSGIGRACALALAEAGRPVSAWDLNGAGAKETAELVAALGVDADWHELDVRDSSLFEAAVDQARDAIGSIGGLVHAAGVPGPMPVDFLDDEQWDVVLDVNLRAEAMLVRALLEDRLEATVPLRRVADPAEVARAVRFLLSDDASYITGEALVVDGGMTSTHGG